MKQTKNFNINVPELGDKPDITQVSDAIQALEDALAGTLEFMNASVKDSKLTLTSGSRTTSRTKYYEGMAIKFIAPIQMNANSITTVSVDGLSDQTLEISYLVNAGDSVDIVYKGNKFVGTISAVQRSNAIDSTSDVTVATSLAVKTLNDNKVEKSTQIIAGNGLTGGGDLSTSKTLNVVSSDDGIVVNADNIKLNIVDSVSETSPTRPASANAVKYAYDKGVEALNKGLELDNSKVAKTGDSMSGSLFISNPSSYFAVTNAENGKTILESSSAVGAIYSYLGGTATSWFDNSAGQGIWRGGDTDIAYWGVHKNGVRKLDFNFTNNYLTTENISATGKIDCYGVVKSSSGENQNGKATNGFPTNLHILGTGGISNDTGVGVGLHSDGKTYFWNNKDGSTDAYTMIVGRDRVTVDVPVMTNSELVSHGSFKTYGRAFIHAQDTYGSSSTISLSIGDSDTGLNWEQDGTIQIHSNGASRGYWNANVFHYYGDLISSANIVAYSDIKLKENLEIISYAIDKIQSINGYTYTRKDTGERQTGVVAQEIQKVLPEAVIVSKDNNGEETLGVAYGNMVGLLIEGIKEQQKKIDCLEERLARLEKLMEGR